MAEAVEAVVRFGPRKLGKRLFERQQEKLKSTTAAGVVFGPRKTGETVERAEREVDQEENQLRSSTANEAAPPPQDEGRPAKPAVEAAPNSELNRPQPVNPFVTDDGLLTVDQVREKLEEEPELFDQAFEAEMQDGEPRKGVAGLLLRLERAKPKPRPTVVKVLAGHAG